MPEVATKPTRKELSTLINELVRWAKARERKELDATPLRRAIDHLGAYRELVDPPFDDS